MNASRKINRSGTLTTSFLLVGIIVCCFFIYKQNKNFKYEFQELSNIIDYQTSLIDSFRNSNVSTLMNNLFDIIDDELKNNSTRVLSVETINRIEVLSYSLKPYKFINGDSLSSNALSPERGILLLYLATMNIDSTSFHNIKVNSSFSHADLTGANLKSADLSYVDLSQANLKDAQLEEVDFSYSDLKKTIFWGANLKKAKLQSADMKRADFSWSDCNKANFNNADLNGANFSNATLKKADLSNTDLQWADLNNALFNGANMERADFFGSNLLRVNMSDAILVDANLRRINLTEANFSGADLHKATVEEEDWMNAINNWLVVGRKEIQNNYNIIDDTTGRTKYQLIKK